MAVRPERKDALSTRPVYLPRVSLKALEEAARQATDAEGASLRLYAESAADIDLTALAKRLSEAGLGDVRFAGGVVGALFGKPQTQVRDAISVAANRLAWAHIVDASKREYRLLPLRSQVDREETWLMARSQPAFEGVEHPSSIPDGLYEAAELQAAYRELLSDAAAAVVVTRRRPARWDASSGRWVEEASVPGAPAIVCAAASTVDELVERARQALASDAR
jgi:hypothetical protein